jgi:hypothetical protein
MDSISQITEYSDASDGILGESDILGGTDDWDYPRKIPRRIVTQT